MQIKETDMCRKLNNAIILSFVKFMKIRILQYSIRNTIYKYNGDNDYSWALIRSPLTPEIIIIVESV